MTKSLGSTLGRLRCCVVAAMAFGSAHAVAAPVVFFGEDLGAASPAAMPSSFAARNTFVSSLASYGTETFEGFTAGQTFPSAGNLTFGSAPTTATITGGMIRNLPFNARFAISAPNFLDTSFNQRITFSAPVSAFGLFITDANENDNDPATVTINGQTLTQEQIEARPFDSIDGIFRIVTERSPGVFEVLFDGGTFPARDSSGMFVGLIDAANPYTNIILINGTSGLDTQWQDGFGYDDMIIGLLAVPEPGTLALLSAALAALALRRRRR